MSLHDTIDDIRERYNTRPTGAGVVRPLPTDRPRIARYRYPSERTKLPTVCGHCGVRLLISDAPTADHPITDLSCLLCSRGACELVYDGLSTRVAPIPTWQCRCGETVLEGEACADCARREVRREQMRARRILEAQKRAGTRPWALEYLCCQVCGKTDSRHHGRGICNRCELRQKRGTSCSD
jgi:hypothetical protein